MWIKGTTCLALEISVTRVILQILVVWPRPHAVLRRRQYSGEKFPASSAAVCTAPPPTTSTSERHEQQIEGLTMAWPILAPGGHQLTSPTPSHHSSRASRHTTAAAPTRAPIRAPTSRSPLLTPPPPQPQASWGGVSCPGSSWTTERKWAGMMDGRGGRWMRRLSRYGVVVHCCSSRSSVLYSTAWPAGDERH
jgi:hypothetical protein